MALTTHPPVQTFGRCGRRTRTTQKASAQPESAHGKPADHLTNIFRKTGKPRFAQTAPRIITTRRKSTEWSAFGKACRATESAACRKILFVLWSWRRESNPRPSDYKSDALPTELRQQTLGKDAPSRILIPRIPARCPGQLVKLSQGQVGVQANRPLRR